MYFSRLIKAANDSIDAKSNKAALVFVNAGSGLPQVADNACCALRKVLCASRCSTRARVTAIRARLRSASGERPATTRIDGHECLLGEPSGFLGASYTLLRRDHIDGATRDICQHVELTHALLQGHETRASSGQGRAGRALATELDDLTQAQGRFERLGTPAGHHSCEVLELNSELGIGANTRLHDASLGCAQVVTAGPQIAIAA
jgi:hypothetical protein